MKVGLFVILGIAVISLVTLFIGQYRLLRGHGYTLYAEFSNVVGLNPGGSVRIAGVEVGEVNEITLNGNKARIVLTIFPDVTVYKDAQVELKTIGRAHELELHGARIVRRLAARDFAPPTLEYSIRERSDHSAVVMGVDASDFIPHDLEVHIAPVSRPVTDDIVFLDHGLGGGYLRQCVCRRVLGR